MALEWQWDEDRDMWGTNASHDCRLASRSGISGTAFLRRSEAAWRPVFRFCIRRRCYSRSDRSTAY
jgi:hypothetical protein